MNRGYTNIPDWMLELDLDIYETIILAVIFGFSQDGESAFKGNHSYLTKKAKCSIRKVRYALTALEKKGYIEKKDKDVNGVHLCEYKACTICNTPARDAAGAARGAYNNIIDNNRLSTNVDNTVKRVKFDFLSALIKLGVSKEVASSWMLVRKNAGATNTEIAFNRIAKEIEKSGRTADECITIAVEKSWRGFEASWLEKRQQTQRQDIPDNKSVNDIWK